jgi:hypothetical protein
MLMLPSPRGDVSGFLLEHLPLTVHALPVAPDPADEEDLHLSLYLCYELHYRGLPGVDPDWEWEPTLLTLRRGLEHRFEAQLLERVRRDDALPSADAADAADAAVLVPDDMLVHDEAFLAVLVFDEMRRTVAKFGIHILLPEVERFEDVTIGVDDVVGAAHQRPSRSGIAKLRHPIAAPASTKAECRSKY